MFGIGEPCSHPGCMSHKTHPCEGCGRQWGQPDRVGEILGRKFIGTPEQVKEYREYDHWVEMPMREFDNGVTATKSELLKVVLECVPEKKEEYYHPNGSQYGACDEYKCGDYQIGYNQAIDDVIEAMERLFGKENSDEL